MFRLLGNHGADASCLLNGLYAFGPASSVYHELLAHSFCSLYFLLYTSLSACPLILTVYYCCSTMPTTEDSTKKGGARSWAKGRTQELLEHFSPIIWRTQTRRLAAIYSTLSPIFTFKTNFGYDQPFNEAPPQDKELDIASRPNPEEISLRRRRIAVPIYGRINARWVSQSTSPTPALVHRRPFLGDPLRFITNIFSLRVFAFSALLSS